MESSKISLDFGDRPKLVRTLRMHASRAGLSQKEVVARALEAYFAHEAESAFLLDTATQAFAEWDNPEDEVYNRL